MEPSSHLEADIYVTHSSRYVDPGAGTYLEMFQATTTDE